MNKTGNENKLSDVKVNYITNNLIGNDILDVGAGRCYYSEWLVKKKQDLRVVALDHSAPPELDGVIYFQTDLEELIPLDDNTFSTIMAFDIIEHILQETQFIKELYRVCKPNGVLIGSVPHDNDKFLPAYNLTFYHRSDLTHKRYYLKETIQQTLERGGFTIEKVDLKGGVSPQVIAEFFPSSMHFFVKKFIGFLRRIGLIKTHHLASDLFFIARKKEKH